MEAPSTTMQLFKNYPAHVFTVQDMPQLVWKELVSGMTIVVTKKDVEQQYRGKFEASKPPYFSVYFPKSHPWPLNASERGIPPLFSEPIRTDPWVLTTVFSSNVRELVIPRLLKSTEIATSIPFLSKDLIRLISHYLPLPRSQMRHMVNFYMKYALSEPKKLISPQQRELLNDLAPRICHLDLDRVVCRLSPPWHGKIRTTQELIHAVATAIARFVTDYPHVNHVTLPFKVSVESFFSYTIDGIEHPAGCTAEEELTLDNCGLALNAALLPHNKFITVSVSRKPGQVLPWRYINFN